MVQTTKERRSHVVEIVREAPRRRIAATAAEAIDGARSIFLDEGRTALLVAEALAARPGRFTIVTGSLANAMALESSGHVTVLLGGQVRGRTLGAADTWTTQMLAGLAIDLAILSGAGIDSGRGLSTSDPGAAAVKSTAVRISARRMFVGVASKFAAATLCRFANVSDLELIITDDALPPRAAERLAALGPRVMRV